MRRPQYQFEPNKWVKNYNIIRYFPTEVLVNKNDVSGTFKKLCSKPMNLYIIQYIIQIKLNTINVEKNEKYFHIFL